MNVDGPQHGLKNHTLKNVSENPTALGLVAVVLNCASPFAMDPWTAGCEGKFEKSVPHAPEQ
jgi:hypothetical protein